jgi:protein involved in polysaccharide export with SLBB domain
VIELGPDQFTTAFGPPFRLEAGDVVRVFPVADRVRNRVTVIGNVWSPGDIGHSPGMRLSQALQLAGGVKPDVYLGRILVSRLQPDSTRIQLRSAFRDSTGAVVNDFALAEDDEIEVFSVSEFRPDRYVAISGAVRNAGRVPFREGMTVRDLVLIAGGLEESAYLERADIARLPESREGGRTATTFSVPLDSTYLFERGTNGTYNGPPGLQSRNGVAPDVPLEPYDNVLILRQPDFELHRTVVLQGEVRFPGTYTLQTKSERVSDLLRKAGGLSTEAYPDGVFFYRRNNNLGRIGIDLPRVLRDASHNDNLILQDGDSIVVPPFSAVVNVTGAVNSPVAVSYVAGRDIDYYIRAAGGPSRNAEEQRAYVTQPNGKVESRGRRLFVVTNPTPRPGSTIHVPTEDPMMKRDLVAAVGSIAQILASLVAIVAVASR